jgi:hypothetical protein
MNKVDIAIGRNIFVFAAKIILQLFSPKQYFPYQVKYVFLLVRDLGREIEFPVSVFFNQTKAKIFIMIFLHISHASASRSD